VTITKHINYAWEDIMLQAKKLIKNYMEDGGGIINEGFEAAMAEIEGEKGVGYEYSGDEAEIVQKIKDLIDTYVKPAVEMDGGNIAFKSFKEGIVTVILQGSCSGCPSSTVTLKNGIETLLKDMLSNLINEVFAING